MFAGLTVCFFGGSFSCLYLWRARWLVLTCAGVRLYSSVCYYAALWNVCMFGHMRVPLSPKACIMHVPL